MDDKKAHASVRGSGCLQRKGVKQEQEIDRMKKQEQELSKLKREHGGSSRLLNSLVGLEKENKEGTETKDQRRASACSS